MRRERPSKEPAEGIASLADWHRQLIDRRQFLLRLAGGSLAALFGSPLRASGPPPSEAEIWQVLDVVQRHLLPSEADAPGAAEINAVGYLRFVVADPVLRSTPPPACAHRRGCRTWQRTSNERIVAMIRSAKSKADEKFAKLQKQQMRALKEREKEQQERAEKVARLRALRLAKEAADKAAAETAAAEAEKVPQPPKASRRATSSR